MERQSSDTRSRYCWTHSPTNCQSGTRSVSARSRSTLCDLANSPVAGECNVYQVYYFEDFEQVWFSLWHLRYVVANLKGNTAYLLDVRAVNKVGAGDAGEFEHLGLHGAAIVVGVAQWTRAGALMGPQLSA